MNRHSKFAIVAVLVASAYHPAKAELPFACGLGEICQSPQFTAYTACVDAATIYWDPKGPTLAPKNFPPARSVLAVLMECEYAAKDFGKRFGNHLANILQQTANERVAAAYGTDPIRAPTCDVFLEYGVKLDHPEPGAVAIPKHRTPGFESAGTKQHKTSDYNFRKVP